jgi:hypothetical protein
MERRGAVEQTGAVPDNSFQEHSPVAGLSAHEVQSLDTVKDAGVGNTLNAHLKSIDQNSIGIVKAARVF